MLTPKQAIYYWRTRAAICTTQGWERSDNERRYQVHAHCRCPRSMKDFTNRDFSRFLSNTAPLREEIDIRDRDRENALHTIGSDAHKAGLDTAYLRRICADLYDTESFEDLPQDKLENFRNIIHNRARAHARQEAEELAPF